MKNKILVLLTVLSVVVLSFGSVFAANVKISKITLSAPQQINPGGTYQITANISPSNATNKQLAWSVNRYASIDANGNITINANAPDTANIQVVARAKDGSNKFASINLTVRRVYVSGISISGPNTVETGSGISLSANAFPENATDKSISWALLTGLQYASIDRNSGYLSVSDSAPEGTMIRVQAMANDGSRKVATYDVTVTAPAAPACVPGLTPMNYHDQECCLSAGWQWEITNSKCSGYRASDYPTEEDCSYGGGFWVNNRCKFYSDLNKTECAELGFTWTPNGFCYRY